VGKRGSLAGFGEVSDEGNSKDKKIDEDVNNNINVNVNKIDDLLGNNKESSKVTGIYFDPDVLRVLDEISKGKKGAKTKIVNEAVKQFLKQSGYMN
jgi:hypothetical protein